MSQKRHQVKIVPVYFQEVENGNKKAEIRKMDRDYKVGDLIDLEEFHEGQYSGKSILTLITHIVTSEEFPQGIQLGYGMLSFKKM